MAKAVKKKTTLISAKKLAKKVTPKNTLTKSIAKPSTKVKPTEAKKATALKTVSKKIASNSIKIEKILIGQPKPESEKSPYFEIARKYKVELDFCPFILVEGINGRDFRKQKVEIHQYSAIIFNSRNAIDHFFRIVDELKIKISAEMKYFCITEAIALYLQKFIVYRKRKIFYGDDGTVQSMLDVIAKHKTKEKYLVPVNDICRQETLDCLDKNQLEFAEVILYKTVCNDIKTLLKKNHNMIIFFTPGSVKSLFENQPTFKQKGTIIGAFGPITSQAVLDAGLTLNLKAPTLNVPSMATALDIFLSSKKGK